jgi:hypothetical protein
MELPILMDADDMEPLRIKESDFRARLPSEAASAVENLEP